MKRLCMMLFLCLAQDALAHMMEAGQGAVRLVGDSAYAVISLPVAALAGVDDNNDGLLDRHELDRHRASVSQQASVLLAMTDGGVAGKVIFEDLLLAHAADPDAKGEANLVVMRRYQWPAPIRALSLTVRMFAIPATASAQLRVRAIDGKRNETFVFSRQREQHSYFAAPQK